jgi:hypothetical protein
MGKGNKFGRGSRANGSMGSSGRGRERGRETGEIKVPQKSGRSAVASKNNVVIKGDGDSGGSEGNCTAGITELAHGYEGRGGKVGDNVDVACGKGKGW